MKKDGQNNSSMMESTTLKPVPQKDRKSWIDIAFITAGGMICVPSLLLGGLLVSEMSLGSAIIAGGLGYMATVLMACTMGMMGSDLGVPTCVIALPGFGKRGGQFLVSSAFTIALLGWYGLQTNLCGAAFSEMMIKIFNVSIPVWTSSLIWGIIMLLTAMYGINALQLLNKIAVPALLLTTLYGTYLAAKSHGTEGMFTVGGSGSMSILSGALMTFSFLAVVSILSPDCARYQRSRSDVVKSSFIGIMPAGVGLLILGCILTGLVGNADITVVLSDLGIPFLGMIVLILATWTTNTLNAYSAGLDIVMMFKLKEESRARVTLISGIVGTLFAVIGIMDHIAFFVDFLGITFAPLAGVMIFDYFILRKGKPENWSYEDGFNLVGIFAWIVGIAANLLIKNDYALLIGMFGSGLVYLLLTQLTSKHSSANKTVYRLDEL